jgi:hypothetical protein
MMKPMFFTVSLSALFWLSGCGSAPTAPLIKSPHYTLGEKDGCTTAKGTYTKDSALFQNNPDYEKGWLAGRKHCNPSFHKE